MFTAPLFPQLPSDSSSPSDFKIFVQRCNRQDIAWCQIIQWHTRNCMTRCHPIHSIPFHSISALCYVSSHARLHHIIRYHIVSRFGVPPNLLHHPETNWKEFYKQISALNDKEPNVWSSVAKGPAPWINMSHLEAVYGPKSRMGGGGSCCTVAWLLYAMRWLPPPVQSNWYTFSWMYLHGCTYMHIKHQMLLFAIS